MLLISFFFLVLFSSGHVHGVEGGGAVLLSPDVVCGARGTEIYFRKMSVFSCLPTYTSSGRDSTETHT